MFSDDGLGRRMRVVSGLMLAASVFIATVYAQTSAQLPQAPAPQPDAQFAEAPAAAQTALLNIVVQDRNGRAIHRLTSRNFRLTEDGAAQTLDRVEEHTALPSALQFPQLPELPSGTFTDYTPIAPGGTLNILLIDALNTPIEDQAFLRNQLQQYVEQANPGTRIAIFGLANHLILLQGFTSDPATLKSVMEHKLIPRVPLPNDRAAELALGPKDTPALLSATYLAANLQEFRAETHAMEIQFRAQVTLDAFNTLGHYLSAFPGRKNLIWFSGSFSGNIFPDPSIQHAVDVTQVDTEEFSETADLLTQAQVAVYPIDARNMMVRSKFNALNSSNDADSGPADAQQDSGDSSNKSQSSEQKRRDRLASEAAAETATETALDTGGEVFADTSDLAGAVAEATAAGADYYSLAYTPVNPEEDGRYRNIRVSLTGAEAGLGLKLFYRRGYYAADIASLAQKDGPPTPSQNALGAAYAQAAMSRGAPMPQSLVLKVRILPASNTTESSLAPGNTLDASVSPKGPFRRYDLDYVSVAKELTLKLAPDGRHTGQMEVLVYVFDTYGRLLNATGKTLDFNLDPQTYARLMQSAIGCHLEVSVPTGVATFIRAGIRDVPSNKFGVVEIPTSIVSHLAPADQKAPSP